MSPRKSSNLQSAAAPASYRKPRPDFYTVMLVIALVALLIGILFLYLELRYYEMTVKATAQVSTGQSASVLLAAQNEASSSRQNAGQTVGQAVPDSPSSFIMSNVGQAVPDIPLAPIMSGTA